MNPTKKSKGVVSSNDEIEQLKMKILLLEKTNQLLLLRINEISRKLELPEILHITICSCNNNPQYYQAIDRCNKCGFTFLNQSRIPCPVIGHDTPLSKTLSTSV